MSEGILAEILSIAYEKWADYRDAAKFAHMQGDSKLYEFNKGSQAALEDMQDMICGYLGTDFMDKMEEEEDE